MSARDIRDRAELLLNNRIGALPLCLRRKARQPRSTCWPCAASPRFHVQGEKLVELVLPEDVAGADRGHSPIPFKVIATDFDAMEERVFETGPLVQAVGASIAIPGVILGPHV